MPPVALEGTAAVMTAEKPPVRMPPRHRASQFGAWLRHRREHVLELTQSDVTDRFLDAVSLRTEYDRSRDQSWLSGLERGQRTIQNRAELESLAIAYDTTPVDLLVQMGLLDSPEMVQQTDPVATIYTMLADVDLEPWARDTIRNLLEQSRQS